MLAIFQQGGRALTEVDPATAVDLPEQTVWLDLREPTPEETAFVDGMLAIELPTREEMREIEASARVYEDDGALFLTATILVNADRPPPGTSEVTFVLKGEPPRDPALRRPAAVPVAWPAASSGRAGHGIGPSRLFFWLVDQIVARTADVLERAALDIDTAVAARSSAPPTRTSRSAQRPDLLEGDRSGSGAAATRRHARANAC